MRNEDGRCLDCDSRYECSCLSADTDDDQELIGALVGHSLCSPQHPCTCTRAEWCPTHKRWFAVHGFEIAETHDAMVAAKVAGVRK